MNSSKTKSSSDVAEIVREANNEDQYRALFSDLLKSFSAARDNSEIRGASEDFEAEKKIVTEVARVESASFTAGVCIGIAAFFSMRFLPRQLIRLMGKEEKLKALSEADARASPAQKAFQLIFEASFGMWVGWAGYKRVAGAQEGSYEMIAKIPLVDVSAWLS